jgi:hypothetical protein
MRNASRLSMRKKSKPKPAAESKQKQGKQQQQGRSVIPFHASDRILLVGEGWYHFFPFYHPGLQQFSLWADEIVRYPFTACILSICQYPPCHAQAWSYHRRHAHRHRRGDEPTCPTELVFLLPQRAGVTGAKETVKSSSKPPSKLSLQETFPSPPLSPPITVVSGWLRHATTAKRTCTENTRRQAETSPN